MGHVIYYKKGQLYYDAGQVLQSGTIITNSDCKLVHKLKVSTLWNLPKVLIEPFLVIDFILWNRIYIRKMLRKEMSRAVNCSSSHQDIVKTKIIKSKIWYPWMDSIFEH